MPPDRNYNPTAGRDARVAGQNRERTASGDARDRVQADAAEIARKAQEQTKQQQEARSRHELFQRDSAHSEALDDQANEPVAEAKREEAQQLAQSVDSGRRDFPAPQAESGQVKEVKDTDWEQKYMARPKAETSKPQPKKPWYQLW